MSGPVPKEPSIGITGGPLVGLARGRSLDGSGGSPGGPHATLLASPPPQPARARLDPSEGLTGGPSASLSRGRTLSGSVSSLGAGSGFSLVTLIPTNMDPVGEVRRYNTISFDLVAFSLATTVVMIGHGGPTELAYINGAWLEPYLASKAFPLPIGKYRFQLRRADGWRFPPSLTVLGFKVA